MQDHPLIKNSKKKLEEERKAHTQGKPRGKKSQRRGSQGFDLGPVDLEKYLTHYGVSYFTKTRAGSTFYCLERCLFDPSHTKNDSAIIQDPAGLIAYQCFHNSCKGRTWKEARQIISGDESLAQFCEGYDPNWQPAKKKRAAAAPIPPTQPFLTENDRGRIDFNASLLVDHLIDMYQPIINEGKDFGGLFYRYHEEEGLWKLLPEAQIGHDIDKILGHHSRETRIVATIRLLERRTFKTPNELSCDPMWLNLVNCMFNTITQETSPHAPEYNSRVQLPVEYDPDAICTKWIETVGQIFADDTAKGDVLQEFFGYCLYPRIIFPCALFQIGGGSNGKGTVQNVLVQMLGRENASHISLSRMEEKFGPIELKDKLLNACGETATKPLEVTRFKEIAAADRVQAEVKYGKDIIFVPIAKHMISMNDFPGIKDKTDAFFRRIIVMEYKQKFEDDTDDKELGEKLAAELNGIFLWSIAGLKRVLEQKAIRVPESVVQAKKRMRSRVNPVLLFAEEECAVNEGEQVLPQELYKAYQNWCDDAKVKALGKQRFYEQIYQNFQVKKNRDGTRDFFFGIGLR